MSEETSPTPKKTWIKFPFVALITASIVVALGLVMVSMYLYNMSGAAQLDLSLPGLQEERLRAQQVKRYDGFNATGKLDEESLKQFDELYKKQKADINRDGKEFDVNVLNNDRLGISVE